MSRAALRALGPEIGPLPWSRAAEARRALAPSVRRRLKDFERSASESWLDPAPLAAFGRALAEVLPSAPCLYPGALEGPPAWLLSPMVQADVILSKVGTRMPANRGYRAAGDEEPFRNRPVALRELAETTLGGARVQRLIAEVLEPVGVFHQLRSVLYDARGRVALFAGCYRPRSERPFDLEEHALLFAMQPTLRRWVRAAEALGVAPIGDTELLRRVDGLRAPAAVLYRDLVVHLNPVAHDALGAESSERLAAWVQSGTRFPLGADDGHTELVLLDELDRRESRERWRVPPYLLPVLELLEAGASDKEIAEQTGAPLATARTYVHRVLRATGVHDRRKLIPSRLPRRRP